MTGVAELWERIEAWFAENLPDGELRLRPPATESAIAAAEGELGVTFPASYRQSLQAHDGQDDEPTVLWLPYAHRLGSLESILDCHRRDPVIADEEIDYDFDPSLDLDRSGRVKQGPWARRLVPIAGSTYWDYDRLAIDYDPGPNGQVGQIVARVGTDYVFVASDFASLLEKTLAGLEAGRIVPADPDPAISGWVRMRYFSARGREEIPASKFYS